MPDSRSPRSVTDVLRAPRFWLAPIVVVSALMSLLAALYLGGILNPRESLNSYPIVLVNQDLGDVVESDGETQEQNFGNDIAEGLVAGIDADQIDLKQTGPAEAQQLLASGEAYGSIVIPSDFTKRALILARASVVAGDVDKPIITVNTNPRAGAFSVSLTQQIAETALSEVNSTVGSELTAQVESQLEGSDTMLSGASRLALAQPIDIITTAYDPLPDGTGGGLSAFYYALRRDDRQRPGRRTPGLHAHRVRSARDLPRGHAYQSDGHARREMGDHAGGGRDRIRSLSVDQCIVGNALTEFAGPLSVQRVRDHRSGRDGAAGLLINLIVFIVLALPSSGGTVPLEASPGIYSWLAQFEPMHQIFLGTRAILYFHGRPDAGLLQAVTMTGVGLLIGLALGLVFTRVYDRKGLDRATAE